MKIIIDLFFIAVIVVVIVDMSGIISTVKAGIAAWLTKHGRPTDPKNIQLKPFDCSLCTTFWVGLGFLIGGGAFSLPYLAALCLVALSTSIIDDILTLVLDAAAALFRWFENRINK